MTALHQIIAVRRGVGADTDKKLAEVKHILAIGGDKDPLTGITRVYESRFGDEGDQLPPENRKVQLTVTELLGVVQAQLKRLFDLEFTREFANTQARADVVVRGNVLLKGVPAGYLLFLEAQVTQLITGLIDRLPALNPAETWEPHAEGVWKTQPKKTERSKKVPQVQVLYEATTAHPAQVRPYETDIIEGYWTAIKFSGQLPARDIQAMRARAVEVLEAVRYAREHANAIMVTDREAGDAILGYVLGR